MGPKSVANGATPSEIAHHYDVGLDFYRLILDRSLTYSCALWNGQVDLEAAQRAKVHFHLDAIGVERGSRVLDIGCGWGSGLDAAVARGALSVTGLTLSHDQ